MAKFFRDGTVLPHYLGYTNTGPRGDAFTNQLHDKTLRTGEIIAIYPPTDNNNASKKYYEYDVMVYRSDGNDVAAPSVYRNCLMQDPIGGRADFFRWTPRFEKLVEDPEKTSNNTRVLLQAINGDASQSIIIGGTKHPAIDGRENSQESADDGHNLAFEFNGVNVKITKDGELSIVRSGPTDAKGDPLDKSDTKQNGGALILIDKDGGINISSGDKKQFITIDHPAQRVDIDADNGVHLGGDDEPLMLGKTYCEAEDSFLTDMNSALSQLSAALSQLTSAMGTLVCAAPGAPVVGAAVAAVAAGQMSSAVTDMTKAVVTFKTKVTGGKNAQVLSPKNTTK